MPLQRPVTEQEGVTGVPVILIDIFHVFLGLSKLTLKHATTFSFQILTYSPLLLDTMYILQYNTRSLHSNQ